MTIMRGLFLSYLSKGSKRDSRAQHITSLFQMPVKHKETRVRKRTAKASKRTDCRGGLKDELQIRKK
ncbi:hypothetical protein [Nitrosopumilus sp.]|uniref:hypothetical protein n=1 Tax=Nitrosopumilus sp. TaxID=2024843 RepID=UPI00292FAAFF|nr:hypothetical protein [Nitrosopumilus sp.]